MDNLTPKFEIANIMAEVSSDMAKQKSGWCHCQKCLLDWPSRVLITTGKQPKRCPYCGSYAWNKPYIYNVQNKNQTKKRAA